MSNIPACLDNFIGILNDCCNIEAPKSGLYINDLEGISSEMASKIADSENNSGLNLMRKKIDFATGLVIDDLRQYLMPRFRVDTVIDTLKAGIFSTNYMSVAQLERGLHIMKTRTNLQRLKVLSLNILTKTTINHKLIKILDGPKVTYYYADLVANKITTLQLNYVAYSDEIYILMDNSDVEVNDGIFYSRLNIGNCNCSRETRRNNYSNTTDLIVYGWNGIEDEDRTFGMEVRLTVECDLNLLVCSLGTHLRYLMLYRSGIELVKEWLTSPRLNEFTLLHADHVGFLLDSWKEEYDRRYKTLIQTIPSLIKSLDDPCISCRGLQYTYGN